MSVLLQLHLNYRLSIWLQCIVERQMQDGTILIWDLESGTHYIWDFAICKNFFPFWLFGKYVAYGDQLPLKIKVSWILGLYRSTLCGPCFAVLKYLLTLSWVAHKMIVFGTVANLVKDCNKYSLLMHCIKIKSRAKSLLNEQYVFVGGNISFLCVLSCISEEA